jgi:hypothetical protein
MKRNKASASDMLEEYDFRGGVRGKYVDRYRTGRNVVLLDPDVARVFADSKAVNQTLRALIDLAHKRVKKRARGSTR